MKVKKYKGSILKLDETSDRYRVCPYCKKPHMVNHLGRDYCSDKCADTHYNQKRRLEKQAKSMLIPEITILHEGEEASVVNKLQVKELKKEAIQKNVKLLDRLPIDDIKGAVFSIPALESFGLDFEHYSIIDDHENLPKGQEARYLLIANYKLERVTKGEIRIIKTIQIIN